MGVNFLAMRGILWCIHSIARKESMRHTELLRVRIMTPAEKRLIRSLSAEERIQALVKAAMNKIVEGDMFKRIEGEDYEAYFERVFGSLPF